MIELETTLTGHLADVLGFDPIILLAFLLLFFPLLLFSGTVLVAIYIVRRTPAKADEKKRVVCKDDLHNMEIRIGKKLDDFRRELKDDLRQHDEGNTREFQNIHEELRDIRNKGQ